MLRTVAFYEAKFITPATNLYEVFTATETPYPSRWHYVFEQYGKDAGFEKSIYEKYVFAWPRIKLSEKLGDIALLNAQPFRSKEKAGRMIICNNRMGLKGWSLTWLPEEEVQRIFRDAGEAIPQPPSLPPLANLPEIERQPLWVRIRIFFGNITANLGLGTGAGKLLMYAAAIAVAALGFLVAYVFLRRAR